MSCSASMEMMVSGLIRAGDPPPGCHGHSVNATTTKIHQTDRASDSVCLVGRRQGRRALPAPTAAADEALLVSAHHSGLTGGAGGAAVIVVVVVVFVLLVGICEIIARCFNVALPSLDVPAYVTWLDNSGCGSTRFNMTPLTMTSSSPSMRLVRVLYCMCLVFPSAIH